MPGWRRAAAAEEPNVLARLRSELAHEVGAVFSDNRHVGVVHGSQGAGENNCLHTHKSSVGLLDEFEGVPAHQQSIELGHEGSEINLRIHDDPVKFSVRTGNETIETGCNPVSYSTH